MMVNRLTSRYVCGAKCKKRISLLTFDVNTYILKTNDRIFCFETIQRAEEECLKSKMAEKYTLSITMTVCQTEKWHRYIRHWSQLKFLPYFQLKLLRIR